ncbi:lysylphosphatidylglycerol synthase transmembrane domain-containing protein [Mesotoga sp. UBA6090]|uniref:lysylphosphatidylglycerol synthase transmembrane domain-containing protein n=1 Tax=Mesotoga sp. UBA6090 TaxID=1946860 RepID=UPI0025D654CD|nr:lysylphosphatidylglycerol synthase transmembrane domain-containing protein [Mesotoga sp. UBA6090]
MKKSTRNSVIAIAVSVLIILIVLMVTDFSKSISYLAAANPGWILLTFSLTVGTWLFEAITLKVFALMRSLSIPFSYLFKITVIGTFFNGITPFSSGGQPAQIVFMQRKGISVGESTAMLVSRFLIYQTVITLLGVVAVFKAYPLVSQKISNLAVLSIFGFALNSIVLVALILFSLSPKLTEKLIHFVIGFLYKIRIVKRKESSIEKAMRELRFFHSSMKELVRRPFALTTASLSTLAQLVCMISIPYFVALSIGTPVNYLEITAVQLILFLVISLIPTPGASGVSEGGYVLFFKSFFGDGIGAALLIWRFFSYFANIIFGGLLTAHEIGFKSRSRS